MDTILLFIAQHEQTLFTIVFLCVVAYIFIFLFGIFRSPLTIYLVVFGAAIVVGLLVLVFCVGLSKYISAPASWLSRIPQGEKIYIIKETVSPKLRHRAISIYEFGKLDEKYRNRYETKENGCDGSKNYYKQSIALGQTDAVPERCLKMFDKHK